MSCAAFECTEGASWRATYVSRCIHWATQKLFCQRHGVEVFYSWMPPHDNGCCYECMAPIEFKGLEKLS